MKTYLFLDDIRMPIDASTYAKSRGVNPAIYKEVWIIVRDYLQFIDWITINGLPELISFDHDLGEADEHTGMDCAKWLVNYCLDNNCALPKWAVHSANPAGYDNIKGLLLNFEKNNKKMNYNISFQERAESAMITLSKQPSFTYEEVREQANRLKKAGEERFKKEAPLIQNELLKLIKPPLSFFDKVHIYRWLFRNQITIEMLSKEVFDEFKETEQYERYIKRSTLNNLSTGDNNRE